MPTPGDRCDNCFYYTAIADGEQGPQGLCQFTAPGVVTSTDGFGNIQWPIVLADDWCGSGANQTTGVSFSAAIIRLPAGPTGPPGPGYQATSSTPLTIAATGSVVFGTEAGLAYQTGTRVRATSESTAQWMEGVVISYEEVGDTASLTVALDNSSGGSASHSDWLLSVAGQTGATGAPGTSGNTVTLRSATSPRTDVPPSAIGNDDDIIIQYPDTGIPTAPGGDLSFWLKVSGTWTLYFTTTSS